MKTLPYKEFPTVSSNKILLKQVLESDLDDIIEIQFYDAKKAKNKLEALEMQNKIHNDYVNGNSIHWCIVDLATHQIVGTLGYYRGFKDATGELGCVLLPQYRGQGFMFYAMQLAIDFGFNTMQLKRIISITTNENINAIKLLRRLDFVKTKDLLDDEVEFEYFTKKEGAN